MKSRTLMIVLLGVFGMFVAAGVTVAAGAVVSRPIGLNGSPDDLGRSLTPETSTTGPARTVTIRKTVTVGKSGSELSGGGSAAAPSPGSASGGSQGYGSGGGGSSGSGAGPSQGASPGAPPRGGERDGDDREDDHDEGDHDDD